MQSLLGGTPVASFMAWGETLSGKISRLSLSGLLFLLKIRMFIPFFYKKEKVGFSRQGNSNSYVLSLFSAGHAVTIPDRNNYANNDMGILYRLYLMYLMYVHNYSAQSVESSERMIVMLCAYLNSFPYRIFIVFYF